MPRDCPNNGDITERLAAQSRHVRMSRDCLALGLE
jgi:hypothetical protein